jgi:hypothetical protein
VLRHIVVPLLSQAGQSGPLLYDEVPLWGDEMHAKKPLTDRAVRALPPAPKGKRRLVWDAIVPGLAVRVTDRGQRSFVLVTRYPGSPHPAPRSLGTVGAISLGDARERVAEADLGRN